MRPTAKFSISFGLVTIPVAAYNATDSSASVSFVRIHTADGGRVRNQPVCSLEDVEISPDEIGRGYKPGDGDTVVPLSDEDLDALPLPTAKTLTILAFVAGGDIDPLQMGKGYYLGIDSPAAAKPYVLLREAMERHQRVGLGKIALHGRETLAMIRPMEGALVMQVLLWPHQIRPMDGVLPERQAEVAPNEVSAAEALMDSFGELSEDDLHDHYREALEEIVAAKLAHREPEFPAGEEQPAGQVMDLMAALQDSVRAAKRSRGEDEEAEPRSGRTAKKSATKKTAAKKTTATKTASKSASKTAAKKATAKKTAAAKKTASRGGRRAG
ncbi:Ku protein [Streptomyces sp. Je 1-4]|uniref:non-homologous end joining protein Ku n=1 Tax=Streptomyces TaxID=1883 RepID=UPI0021D99F8A|nr:MULTISPECIES: Ku protein [unclassified Streptomyces]UYB45038.1 Ku protein [Streptomyces sp. Je 1-4]UZQ40156.1 Ku protein [Streptomyces sp. Je 1-4] [Streptomyces sp. Je 1-4 4N24]UZQ47573.1 Ku protein [Streptomyces sp. Je 1-4] [Streptomyces sp. Je 1-4 4N24_ara]